MKIKKEIKPFKMRCESVAQFNKVKIILTENNISQIAASGNRDLLINAYLKDDVLVYTTFEKHFNEPEPELTYSEFMKLHGEEEAESISKQTIKDIVRKHVEKLNNIKENLSRWDEENWTSHEIKDAENQIKILASILSDLNKALTND